MLSGSILCRQHIASVESSPLIVYDTLCDLFVLYYKAVHVLLIWFLVFAGFGASFCTVSTLLCV